MQYQKTFCNYLFLLLLILLQMLLSTSKGFCQTKLTIPNGFMNLSANSRAIEKDFKFTLDSGTNGATQNFTLDKTGVILHLVPAPKIKDSTTKLRIFSNDGKKIQTYDFIDGTVFALVDPQFTYSVFQEIVPDCSVINKALNLDPASTICPSLEMYKLYENIMISEDTSFKITLRVPSEFYSIPLSIPQNTQQLSSDDFSNIKASVAELGNSSISLNRSSVNIASLLNLGTLCFASKRKSAPKTEPVNCNFVNNNTGSIISYKNSFLNKDLLNQFNLVFSFVPGKFNALSHSYLFGYQEDVKSDNPPVEINASSPQKYFFENNTSDISINLGQISYVAKKNKKGTYVISTPITIDKVLNDSAVIIPLNKLDPLINLTFNNMTFEAVLSNISIASSETPASTYNISIGNNVVIQNLIELDDAANRLQTSSEEGLFVSSYLPEKLSNLTLNREYTFVEQFRAPSVDSETGKAIEVVNNKSRADLTFTKKISNIDLVGQANLYTALIERPTILLNNKSFTQQGSVSGFIAPPDLRPVIESGYRSTIEFNMTLNLANSETLKILYADLKTKDETPLTNFFSFSYLPFGIYDGVLKFDSDRIKFFQNAGIVKTED